MLSHIPEDWQIVSVAEIAAPTKYACVGGPFGSNLTRSDYIEFPGVPVIRGTNLGANGTKFSPEEFVFVSETKAESLRQNLAFPGDLLFTQRGTLGQIGFIPTDAPFDRFVVSQSQMKLTVDGTKASPSYVYYYFCSHEARDYIIRNAVVAGVPHINLAFLRRFPVPLPPLPEQKAIARILGSLDDKIELNREMNQTLEAMAQAIFKSWFVDFDPVVAKSEGRHPYGMNAETAALFPDRFVDSELGPIPEGWEVGPIHDLFFLQRGFDLPKKKRLPGSIPVYSASGVHGFHSETPVVGPGVITGRSGVLGKVFLCPGPYWPLNTTLWTKELRLAGPLFAYHFLRTWDLSGLNVGSAVPSLNRNHLHIQNTILPPKGLLQEFEEVTSPLIEKIKQNEDEDLTLAELRDTLLTKLLSGEIRVGQAEKQVEEVL